MTSEKNHSDFEKLSEYIHSQLSEITSLIEQCKLKSTIMNPREFQDKMETEIDSIQRRTSNSKVFTFSELTALFKSLEEYPPNLQKPKIPKDLSHSVLVRKEDSTGSNQSLTIGEDQHLQLNPIKIAEDFAKCREHYESFLKRISKNEKKNKQYCADIENLNKIIADVEKLLPRENRDNTSVVKPQQKEYVRNLAKNMEDFIYFKENHTFCSGVESMNNAVRDLEIIVPIINELLQNISLKL